MNWSIDRLQDVWQLASQLHYGQTYGGPNEGERVEYINHIASVVFEILNIANQSDEFDTDFAIHCAVLHDAIEDTNFDYTRTKELFGGKIAEGVLSLTKNESLSRSSGFVIPKLNDRKSVLASGIVFNELFFQSLLAQRGNRAIIL